MRDLRGLLHLVREEPTPLDEWDFDAVEGREFSRARRDARLRRQRAQRLRAAVWLGAGLLICTAVLVVAGLSLDSARQPLAAGVAQSASVQFGNWFGDADDGPARRAMAAPAPAATPVFARIGGLRIHLPISPSAVTVIGFHQASGSKAYDMKSMAPDVQKGTETQEGIAAAAAAQIAASECASAGLLPGSPLAEAWPGAVIRMWRSRPGKPDSAADCGAKAGTCVLAPVTGVVTQLKPYKLYGKWSDIEVHIRPDGYPRVDCILLHVTDIRVVVGQRVLGGSTPVAAVRLLSPYLHHQLADYTGEAGDHVHVQLNRPQPTKVARSVSAGQP
jgi:hypothetical protein